MNYLSLFCRYDGNNAPAYNVTGVVLHLSTNTVTIICILIRNTIAKYRRLNHIKCIALDIITCANSFLVRNLCIDSTNRPRYPPISQGLV